MMVISDFCSDTFCIYNCHSSFFTWLVFSSKCIKIQKSEKCEKWLQKVKICNCTKCVNLHNTSKDNLFCLRCENSLHCKCTRISPKDFSKYKKGKKNLFTNFALPAPVLTVTCMSSMVRKEFYVMFVIYGYTRNVQKLPRLSAKILETVGRNLGTTDLVKPTWVCL